jgi:hypothetical protein
VGPYERSSSPWYFDAFTGSEILDGQYGMTTNTNEDSRIQQLEHLCHELADTRSELSLLRDRHKTGSDLLAIFIPHNPNAARIEMRLASDFGVDLLLGQGAPFEVPFKGGYHSRKSWLDEVRAFCMAVMAGNFEEKLIIVRGELRGSDHQLVLPSGKKIVEHWRTTGLILPWSKKEVRLVRYEPY